jgi:hypothetical protein
MSVKTRLTKLESAQVSNIASDELDNLSVFEKYKRMLNNQSYRPQRKLNHFNALTPDEAYKMMVREAY